MSDLNSIDFSQFQSWPKVVMPSGNIYYAIPGTGYVYDPTLTLARTDGKKVIYFNPKPTLDQKKKQQEQIDNQNSVVGQYGPLVAGTAAAIGGKLTYDYLTPETAQQQLANAQAQQQLNQMNGAQAQPVQVAPQQAAVVSPQQQAFVDAAAPSYANTGVAPNNVYPVGTAANGGTLMSDGSVIGGSSPMAPATNAQATGPGTDYLSTIGPYAQGALGAYQAYQGYQQYQNGDKVGGGLGMASGGTNVAAAAGSSAAGSAAPYLAGAMLAYNIGKDVNNINKNDLMTDDEKAYKRHEAARKEYENYYTLGLMGGLNRSKFSRGTMKKLDSVFEATDLGAKLVGAFGSSKDSDQLYRDAMRKGLQQYGIANDNFEVTLADGSTYNIGADGKHKLANLDGSERHPYDTDLTNPLAVQAAHLLRPTVDAMLGPDTPEKRKGDLIGMLNNAVMQNATTIEQVQANINAINAKAAQTKAAKDAEEAAKGQAPAQTFAAAANPYQPVVAPVVTHVPVGDSDYVNRGAVPVYQPAPVISKGPALMQGTAPIISKGPQPIQAGNVLVNNAPPPGAQVELPRSSTRSPGIALDGRRLSQDEMMGKKLADNMNKKRKGA